MSNTVRTLICRRVYGFCLYAVWTDTTSKRLLKYEIILPSGGVLPFPRDALPAALETFRACTGVWFWFAPPYELRPVFKHETSDEVLHYEILDASGVVFRSSSGSNDAAEAIAEFGRLTGVHVGTDDNAIEYRDPGM